MENELEEFIEDYKEERFKKPQLDNKGKPVTLWGIPVVIVNEPDPDKN